MTHCKRYTACLKGIDELDGRPFTEFSAFAGVRAIEQGSIFRHDAIEDGDSRKNCEQVLQLAAGHEQQFAARRLEPA